MRGRRVASNAWEKRGAVEIKKRIHDLSMTQEVFANKHGLKPGTLRNVLSSGVLGFPVRKVLKDEFGITDSQLESWGAQICSRMSVLSGPKVVDVLNKEELEYLVHVCEVIGDLSWKLIVNLITDYRFKNSLG